MASRHPHGCRLSMASNLLSADELTIRDAPRTHENRDIKSIIAIPQDGSAHPAEASAGSQWIEAKVKARGRAVHGVSRVNET